MNIHFSIYPFILANIWLATLPVPQPVRIAAAVVFLILSVVNINIGG